MNSKNRLRKGEMPENTGIFTICKICKQSKDDSLFKWQNGKRAGLVCRACDLAKKREVYKTDDDYRNSAISRARLQEPNLEVQKTWRDNNQDRLKARRISYHIENRDKINAKSLAWYENSSKSNKFNIEEFNK